MNTHILKAETDLWDYLRACKFKGWDPFDGLNSKLFKVTPLNHSRFFRLAWLQFFKRCPINFRPLALVPKGFNAKGLALMATASILRNELELANSFLSQLEDMRSPNYQDWCWGYNFDWQARAFYVPEGTPNMVTSAFVANAYLDRYDITRNDEDLSKAIGVCNFIANSLTLNEDSNTACFGYIPGESARVHNANMLGAALMARTAAQTGSSRFTELSGKAMRYSVEAMRDDGAWPYGERSHHTFVDNFHSAYNLVSLHSWMQYTGSAVWEKELAKGVSYFTCAFWLADGTPKYYDSSIYPIDTHCSAMGIVACVKLAKYLSEPDLAERIALWAIQNLQTNNGAFVYQKHKHYTNSIPYMRWTQAWMAYGLAHATASQYHSTSTT